jgi:hypothetical protein
MVYKVSVKTVYVCPILPISKSECLPLNCEYHHLSALVDTVLLSIQASSFGGLEVACWPLVPKFAGSDAGKKILSTPSSEGE